MLIPYQILHIFSCKLTAFLLVNRIYFIYFYCVQLFLKKIILIYFSTDSLVRCLIAYCNWIKFVHWLITLFTYPISSIFHPLCENELLINYLGDVALKFVFFCFCFFFWGGGVKSCREAQKRSRIPPLFSWTREASNLYTTFWILMNVTRHTRNRWVR